MVYVQFNFLLMVYIHNSFLFMINYNCCRLLDKLVLDEEECDKIRQQLSQYMLGQGAFGTNHALRDRGNLSSLVWWNVYGGGTPRLQCLATRVLSQVVNTSSA
jgi:hypothetical protein